MSTCIFCAIVRGEAPATRVHEDDDLLAFLDIRPVTRGHTLVIAKTHAERLDDLDAEVGSRIFALGHRVALALGRSDLAADGANLWLNDGPAAFQTVGHIHLHVIPRHHGDRLRFVRGLLLRRGGDAETTATLVRDGLARLEQS